MAPGWLCWALLLLLPAPVRAAGPGPVLVNRPFVTVWNIPSEPCAQQYNVTLPLGVFDVVANTEEAFIGQDIALFYSSHLGLFPYYTAQGQPVDGGLPQNASLVAHLQRARRDIGAALPSTRYDGLAVVDWEQWRPLWARDWSSMDIYREKSEELVRRQHPLWPHSHVEEVAQQQFQKAARAFMEQTLRLGEAMRPAGYWGFYGFPDCYNNNFSDPLYNGSCPVVEQQRNQELGWLWNCSRALYPSIYLPQQLQGTDKVLRYVRYRVAEAFAVQKGILSNAVPVLPYTEIIYANTSDFLSELLLRRPADSSGDARPRLRGRGRAGPKRRAPADAARPPPRAAAAALPAPAAAARGDTWRLLAPCPLPPPTARIAPVRTVFSPCHLRPLTAPNLAPCPPPLRAPWAALPALATPGWQCPCCWGRWWLQPLWPCCSPQLPWQPLLWPCCSPHLLWQPLLWPCCSPRLPSQPPVAPSSPAYQQGDHGLAAQSGQCEGREESSPGGDQGPVEVADEEEDIEIVVE